MYFYLAYPANPEPVVLTIDLEQVQQVSRVVVHGYSISDSYETYTVAVSSDGKDYKQVARRMEKPATLTAPAEHRFEPQDVHYVRIVMRLQSRLRLRFGFKNNRSSSLHGIGVGVVSIVSGPN